MSRREIRHTRRTLTRARRWAEQVRARQQNSDYWTAFRTDLEVTR